MEVEIDESCFSHWKLNVGRCLPTQWVFDGYCRQTKESFLIAVEDRLAVTLLPIIKNYILQGSKIYFDELTDLGSERDAVCHKYILLILRQAHTLKELSRLGAWQR